jgi:hypothetical protein
MAVWLFSGFISHGLNFRMFEHNLFCFFFFQKIMETALRRKHIAQASYLSLTFFYCHVLCRRMHRVKPPLHNRTYVCRIPQGMRSAFYTDVRIVCCNGAFCRGSVPHGFPMGSPWVPHGLQDMVMVFVAIDCSIF